MSIVINGFDMPQNTSLWLAIKPDGTVHKIKCGGEYGDPKIGTAVPLPEKHGRLGDLDAFEAKLREEALQHTIVGDLNQMTLGAGEFIDRIKAAPTIVPAEGGGEG